MNLYQTLLVIIAANSVPAILGGTVTFLWLKYVKGWRKPEINRREVNSHA